MKPKVFIVNQPMRRDPETRQWIPAIDLSAAGHYGDLRFLFSRAEIPERAPINPDELLPRLRHRMMDFGSDDYLVIAGDLALLVYAAGMAMQKNDGKIRLLRWHPHLREYFSTSASVWQSSAPASQRADRRITA